MAKNQGRETTRVRFDDLWLAAGLTVLWLRREFHGFDDVDSRAQFVARVASYVNRMGPVRD